MTSSCNKAIIDASCTLPPLLDMCNQETQNLCLASFDRVMEMQMQEEGDLAHPDADLFLDKFSSRMMQDDEDASQGD